MMQSFHIIQLITIFTYAGVTLKTYKTVHRDHPCKETSTCSKNWERLYVWSMTMCSGAMTNGG